MKTKLKTLLIYIFVIFFSGCEDNTERYSTENKKNSIQETKNNISMLLKKNRVISLLAYKKYSENKIENNVLIHQKNKEQKFKKFFKKKTLNRESSLFPTSEIDQMPIPFLPPKGYTEKDTFFIDIFFYILEIQETLRDIIEHYNKFTINTNLNILSHPAQIDDHSEELLQLIKFRRIVIEEIEFVKNEIKRYNDKISSLFTNVSHHDKMNGYYSFDNSHLIYKQTEFSIEDVDNISYSYKEKLITKDVLKSNNVKVKIHKPEVGKRRGTVFVSAGRPNVLRGALGNGFGGYELGALIGMAIEYAITGKIYYYKGAI